MNMKIVTVIPWKETPSRKEPFQALIDWYQTNLPDIEIILVNASDEVWLPSATRNLGVRKAQEAGCDVVIINDADTIPELHSLLEAAKLAYSDGMVHNPYRLCKTFTYEESKPYYDGVKQLHELRGTEHVTANGGIYVCTPEAWWKIGGMDEKFKQWGYEDSAFEIAHGIINGCAIVKNNGTIYSLGHELQIHDAGYNDSNMNNRDTFMRYLLINNPEDMLKLVKQPS
jgi:hypothetical protein